MRRYKLIVVLLFMTTLTGCIQKFEYSEQQSDAAAEYIAGVMLKNDKNYVAEMVSIEKIIEKQEAEATATVTPTPVNIQNTKSEQGQTTTPTDTVVPEIDYTLTEVIGEEGFEIEYTDFIVAESYPEDVTDAYFSITPRSGYQLMVLSFLLKNTLDKENNLNLTKADIVYKLDVNVGTIYEPPFALLENNLKLIDLTLKSSETKPVVLIFEIKKDVEMKDVNLMVTRDNRSVIIKIK
jgi:hypothetical protein